MIQRSTVRDLDRVVLCAEERKRDLSGYQGLQVKEADCPLVLLGLHIESRTSTVAKAWRSGGSLPGSTEHMLGESYRNAKTDCLNLDRHKRAKVYTTSRRSVITAYASTRFHTRSTGTNRSLLASLDKHCHLELTA